MAANASTSRNPGQPYSVFIQDKLATSGDELNACDIYCPLERCRCLILRKGHAKLVKRNAAALQHSSAKVTSDQLLQSSSSASQGAEDKREQDVWLVTSPLTFENIGFTKGVLSNSNSSSSSSATSLLFPELPEGASVRYLSCADCDCGPLGWHVESKGRDLGREVEDEVRGQGNGNRTAQASVNGPVREFLLAVGRCRYKIDT